MIFDPSEGGGWNVSSPASNPLLGNSSPTGASSLNLLPTWGVRVNLGEIGEYTV